QTQVQSLKKGVSNSATEESIMNAHNKTQFTYAKNKCALKDSICDSPISKNLMPTILASNASSSLTKVFKCPHTRNDSIFTQWFIVTQDQKGLLMVCNGAECKVMRGSIFLKIMGNIRLSLHFLTCPYLFTTPPT
ncbi:hypothetical protein H5410_031074, partial [Solanum commersonii]